MSDYEVTLVNDNSSHPYPQASYQLTHPSVSPLPRTMQHY